MVTRAVCARSNPKSKMSVGPLSYPLSCPREYTLGYTTFQRDEVRNVRTFKMVNH